MFKDCPICGKELINKNSKNECENGCYSMIGGMGLAKETVFDKEFIFDYQDHSETWKRIEKALNDEITYWKTDDRYIARLLGCS